MFWKIAVEGNYVSCIGFETGVLVLKHMCFNGQTSLRRSAGCWDCVNEIHWLGNMWEFFLVLTLPSKKIKYFSRLNVFTLVRKTLCHDHQHCTCCSWRKYVPGWIFKLVGVSICAVLFAVYACIQFLSAMKILLCISTSEQGSRLRSEIYLTASSDPHLRC